MSYVIKLQIVLQVQIAIKAQIIENVCFICKSYVLKDFFFLKKILCLIHCAVADQILTNECDKATVQLA